ncbi:MAG: ParB/RepB/Spo0J family partition protein [Alphaproteobacteria bacterium]|nr:ParB/RepB/Spo0J family partition protein [Alphaproteobacteria bacterium]MCL2890135.1 ParB/RepB/Spo0J family partition protein [Alphaproteobacteria bacterium]
MSKFGLGKGLADLKAEMGAPVELGVLAGGERVVVKQISISQIIPNPDQPRKTFAPAELNDLAASIKEKGVLQPILLRMGKNGQYEIVAGERRWRASQIAGLSDIPALVKTLSDSNTMEIALIENVQRENLNPMEESAAYVNLISACAYQISDVSRIIGKSESYVRNIMRLDALPESVKELVRSGELSSSHARAILVAENPAELAKKILDAKISVSDTEKMVKNVARSSSSRSFRPNLVSDKEICQYQKQIGKAIGAPVKFKMRKGGAGDIIIRFETKIQMDKLIEKLSK